MIPVGLGALLGLGVFFRGVHLLQKDRPVLSVIDGEKAPAPMSPATPSPSKQEKRTDAQPLGDHREIIRLSPSNGEETASRARTQQGQIAAALVKAGISSPISWSAQVSEMSVRTVETPVDHRSESPATLMQALDLNASTALKEGRRVANSGQKPLPQEFRWTPALMIWGGAVLTLGCIYLLAIHCRWL